MIVYSFIVLLSIVGWLIHFFMGKKPKTKENCLELMLLYQLVFSIGVLGILSFLGHTLYPQVAANFMNWPTSHYQQELANASLGFGVLGIMCIWFRGTFWTATIIGSSVWLFGDAVDHIYDMFINHNFSNINTGVVFYSDLLTPIAMVFLLCLLNKWKKAKMRPARSARA